MNNQQNYREFRTALDELLNQGGLDQATYTIYLGLTRGLITEEEAQKALDELSVCPAK